MVSGLVNIGDARIPPANGDSRETNWTPFAAVNVFTIDTRTANSYSPAVGHGDGPGLMDLMTASVAMVGKAPVKKEAKK
jgi:hypothetical protein